MSKLLFASATLCLLPLLSAAPATGADTGAAYGRDFVRDGAVWPEEAGPPLTVLPAAPTKETRDQLRQRVAELEIVDGPYSASIAEPLSDLARALEASGLETEAKALRDRALHLLRVNEGLYSPLQVPLLRDQLDADRRRDDYEALDNRYSYYHRLFGKGTPPYTELRLGATLEYFRWQREALRREIDDGPISRLFHLVRESDEWLRRAADPEAPAHADVLVAAALNQLRNNYLLADLITPRVQIDPRGTMRAPPQNDVLDYDPKRERLEMQRRGQRRRVDAMLRDLLNEVHTATDFHHALLLRERADWALWWGSVSTARELYLASWERLLRSGQRELAEEWYGRPRPLPDNGVFNEPGREIEAYVDLQISVDARGVARGRILGDESQLPRSARGVPRKIRDVRFRPALVDGKPQPADIERWRFAVYD